MGLVSESLGTWTSSGGLGVVVTGAASESEEVALARPLGAFV